MTNLAERPLAYLCLQLQNAVGACERVNECVGRGEKGREEKDSTVKIREM
jgi:hypothetical protein